MTIEITNNSLLGQAPTPGEEARTGAAQKNNTIAQSEAGKPIDSVHISENAENLNSVIQTARSELPVIDTQRVERAFNKIKSGTFEIDDQKIAAQMLFIDENLPIPGNTGEK